MARLVIIRESTMIGMACKMNCYINEKMVCQVKNGEQVSVEVESGILKFKCGLTLNNPLSDIVQLDMRGRESLTIIVKPGMNRPKIDVKDVSAVVAVDSMKAGNVARTTKFVSTKSVDPFFGVNENTKQIAITRNTFLKNVAIYNYEDILSFELIEDGTCVTKGGLGSAAVGGVLFGGVGAIVGGVTGSKKAMQKCTSLMVKITVKNMETPAEYIKLIVMQTDKNSYTYKHAYKVAQEIISILQLICDQRDAEMNQSREQEKNVYSNVNPQETSTADEIRKFKELMDEGIITEEEFLLKKKQLLGL